MKQVLKRHVWSRRMKTIIDHLNEEPQVQTNSVLTLPLPNIIDLVENNWDNKNKLIKSLNHYNETIHSLFEQAKKYHDVVEDNKKLKRENETLENDLKKMRQEANYFKNLYMELSVKSTYNLFREKEGIKESVISINKNKNKALSTDIVSQYPDLFED